MKKVVRVTILGMCVLPALVIAAGALFVVTVCSLPEVTGSDLIGNYVGCYDVFPKIASDSRNGIYKGGTHQLRVQADRTYVYIYRPTDNNSITITGTWTLMQSNGGASIVLEDFTLAPSGADMKQVRNYHELPIHKPIWGPIRVIIDDDHGYYWIKVRR